METVNLNDTVQRAHECAYKTEFSLNQLALYGVTMWYDEHSCFRSLNY